MVFNISQNNRWEFVKYYFKKQKNKEKRLNKWVCYNHTRSFLNGKYLVLEWNSSDIQ